MWGLSLFTAIMLIVLGIAIGMYLASQIMESIEQSKRHKKFMHDMDNFEKNKGFLDDDVNLDLAKMTP